ncbi:5-formyltetrahydrofolate cyclo-ligase [Haloferula luteola]|uniref:5-formyltetrahydrofolate cyclo-ligase n=1 Tax=Haloferula luteola TaxID=595692 RepID=A0A840VEP2_9BACT|nr:5-formyltetrahydrofolate cyclo-ligase [Haloferula luteola]MBB5352320.1 5-formyltetrahydrofolate cyclo-ligase [Haloferula luteola]
MPMQATTPGPNADKRSWRTWLRAQHDPHPQDTSLLLADSLKRDLSALPPSRIALFCALPDEPDLTSLIGLSPHRWYLPRVDGQEMHFHEVHHLDDLRIGAFGIREPHPDLAPGDPTDLDLILCPGLGFGRDGSRLGRGRGYYDRLLHLAPSAQRVGATFPCRIVDHLPTEPHDIPMHRLLEIR